MTGDLFAPAWIGVISLWQPWASLVFARLADGQRAKVHETRSWPVPLMMRGQQLGIHAAKRRPRAAELSPALIALCEELWGDSWAESLPYGAVPGLVRLGPWGRMPEIRPAHAWDLICGDWSPGRYAWRLDDSQLLAKPIPMIGRQGIWRVEPADLELAA